MSAPVTMRSNWSHLFGSGALPALDVLFEYVIQQYPSLRSQLFEIKSSDRDIEQASELHDLELMPQVGEGEDYSMKRAKQGGSKTFTHVKYGMGVSISEEAIEDGKFDLLSKMVKQLARSAMETQEVNSMNVFNNGFSSVTTADGVALFSASHTLPSGGTNRNILSTAADLSPTSLEQALIDFETQFISDGGIIQLVKPKILLCAPANKRYAMELIGSELKADSTENNMNSLKQDSLRVVSSPHLTDTDAWFLLADPSDSGRVIYNRKSISTKTDAGAGFLNDSIIYKSSYRESLGAINHAGSFGTAGA